VNISHCSNVKLVDSKIYRTTASGRASAQSMNKVHAHQSLTENVNPNCRERPSVWLVFLIRTSWEEYDDMKSSLSRIESWGQNRSRDSCHYTGLYVLSGISSHTLGYAIMRRFWLPTYITLCFWTLESTLYGSWRNLCYRKKLFYGSEGLQKNFGIFRVEMMICLSSL